MTETQVSCFMATAESKSVTKASEKIFRSPQAISKHIAHLEEELGCELFERSSKGVVLTPIGEEYYTYFRTNHNQLKHTLNTIHYMYDVMRLHFRIGMSTWLNPFGKLYDGISYFMDDHPATTFDLLQDSNNALFSAIAEDKLDIAIMCNSQISDRTDNHIELFAKEDLRLFISKYLLNDAKESEYILYDASYGAWSQQQWESTATRLSQKHVDFDTKALCHMPNLQSALISAENHGGMVVCDSNFGYLTADHPDLENVPIAMESSLACVWNKRNENPLIREFADFLKNFYKNI